MSDALLSLRHVSLRLNETDVLENVNLSVQPGEIVTLIGPNGAGKTSLVRVVLGLLKATSGEVRRRPRLRIGYMPQKLQVDPSLPLTVLRFLLLVPGVRRPAGEAVQGVDVNGQIELYQLITRLRDRYGCGVLMVSHDLHLVMATTNTVVCINRHVCCSGHPEQVSTDPAFVAMFGEQASALAVYSHHHDHGHDLHGEVVPHEHGPGCKHA